MLREPEAILRVKRALSEMEGANKNLKELVDMAELGQEDRTWLGLAQTAVEGVENMLARILPEGDL